MPRERATKWRLDDNREVSAAVGDKKNMVEVAGAVEQNWEFANRSFPNLNILEEDSGLTLRNEIKDSLRERADTCNLDPAKWDDSHSDDLTDLVIIMFSSFSKHE